MNKKIQAVLFDLDGTLADTALDLGLALNNLLKKHGFPEKTMDEIRPFASHGSGALVEMGTGLSRDNPDFELLRQEYLTEYNQCVESNQVLTTLFEDINEVLIELNNREIKWGVITNKPARFTEQLMPKLHCEIAPAVVVSGDTCAEAKPSVLPMLYACEQIDIQAENCLYIGDAERDMLAGKNAGMKTALAEWGYIAPTDDTDSWAWDFSLREPLDILAVLNHLNLNN